MWYMQQSQGKTIGVAGASWGQNTNTFEIPFATGSTGWTDRVRQSQG